MPSIGNTLQTHPDLSRSTASCHTTPSSEARTSLPAPSRTRMHHPHPDTPHTTSCPDAPSTALRPASPDGHHRHTPCSTSTPHRRTAANTNYIHRSPANAAPPRSPACPDKISTRSAYQTLVSADIGPSSRSPHTLQTTAF